MNEREKTVMPQGTDEDSIDLLELARVLWGRALFIILGMIVGAAAVFAVMKFLITPEYEATSTIYIFSKTTSITSLADLQIGSQLTEDFQIIATTREVVESVIAEHSLDETYETLSKKISVNNPNASHMLSITVTDTDPGKAAAVSNAISDKLRDQIADIMNTDRPSVVERAVIPKKQSSPNVKRNTVIGALAGAVLVAGFIIIRYLMDDTVKSSDDVEKYLGLDTLAELPYIREKGKAKKRSGNGYYGYYGPGDGKNRK
ncbi:MAG: polysaccharide export protein [Christensenellaceae bacterium]|nr:polysaccharide export protein [Christensenellaceae bacterium]